MKTITWVIVSASLLMSTGCGLGKSDEWHAGYDKCQEWLQSRVPDSASVELTLEMAMGTLVLGDDEEWSEEQIRAAWDGCRHAARDSGAEIE